MGWASVSRSPLESGTKAGDSPVGEDADAPNRYPSRVGHVKPGLNRRGPSRKAKYSMTTDSEPSRRPNGGKNPDQGRRLNLKPRAYERWEGDAFGLPDRVPFA